MESMATIRMKNYGELVKAGINNERALKLQQISRSLHRLDENSCNYGLTERQEKREERLEKTAESIAKEYGFVSYHQSDPRGWSLYLVNPKTLEGKDIHSEYDRGMAVYPH